MTSFFRGRYVLAGAMSICLFTVFAISAAYAKEVGIRLTPTVIEIHPQEDGIIEKSITVENSGRDPVDLGISIKAFTTTNKGEIIYPSEENIDPATKELIATDLQVLENNTPVTSLSLDPGQRQSLTLKINIKNIQNISQYTLSLFFVSKSLHQENEDSTQDESPIKTELNIAVGSALHILVFGKKEDALPSITITSFKTENFIQQGPVYFYTRAKNSSHKYINVHGIITITNIFGQQIGIVRIPNQLLPAEAEKELSAQVDKHSAEKAITWPESILFGSYKARLTVSTDMGNEASSEATFFAFPTRSVLLVLIALLIASFIIGQVREKVK